MLEEIGDGDLLTADQVAAKINRLQRGEVPIGCNHLTMFIDVQAALLFYVVAAWEDDFTGYVIDYGAYPDQKRPYFTLRDARQTLAMAAPGTGLEGAIYAGLESLTGDLLGREWRRDDGAGMRIERCLIDANWGNFDRRGLPVLPAECPLGLAAAQPRPIRRGVEHPVLASTSGSSATGWGCNWRIPNVQGKRAVRHVVFDTNYWKSFVHARLAVAMGDRGCLSLFGDKPDLHRLFAEHVTAEYRVKTEGRGRTVDEWKLRPEASDNHWLDCLVGCAVAASIQGVVLPGTDAKAAPRRPRVRLSELAAGEAVDDRSRMDVQERKRDRRGLACPRCNCRHLPVLYTRQRVRRIVRVRQCRHCGRRIITYESIGAWRIPGGDDCPDQNAVWQVLSTGLTRKNERQPR